jgi:hypothetical protein
VTAPTLDPVTLNLRLPFTEYADGPCPKAHVLDWTVEKLLALWCDSGERDLLDVIAQLCPHMDRDGLDAAVLDLCDISAAVEEWRNRPGHWPQFEASIGDYRRALSVLVPTLRLATMPGGA